MSYKSYLIKMVVNNTPKCITIWLLNKKLQGVAELTDFELNFDKRKIYTQLILAGEQEPVEVFLEDISIVKNEASYMLLINHVKSNRAWIDTLLARVIADRAWRIPDSKVELVCELFAIDPEND
ncbi:MAG: hypothetical protein KAJ03_04615 [Gammaproteobacteria bacterium]|nr:hypothetical protein [Gammaproteobacteria bacterium]